MFVSKHLDVMMHKFIKENELEESLIFVSASIQTTQDVRHQRRPVGEGNRKGSL